MNAIIKQRIESGLRTVDRSKFDGDTPQNRVMIVMYFATVSMSAQDLAPFVNLKESEVEKILEAST